MSRLNIEIKARTTILAELEEILLQKDAKYLGVDHQIDTFFEVSYGKLKLREGNIENTLIQYQKTQNDGLTESNYQLYRTENLSEIKPLLSKALGVLKVVDKHRKIFYIKNAKIHLDNVKDLGEFVEIEIIAEYKDMDPRFDSLEDQCRYYKTLLKIQVEDMLDVSYVDML